MDYVRLGRTDILASVMALGCGGPSALGRSTGRTDSESVAVVREAANAGINVIDTAEGYGTEKLVAAG